MSKRGLRYCRSALSREFSKLKDQSEPQVFTKLANVKSRLTWTAEHRKLLTDMWERGEKAAAIAAAFGCKVGAINVARARFGLKPRRIVSGRPNALASRQLVDFVEAKLRQHGIRKIVPVRSPRPPTTIVFDDDLRIPDFLKRSAS